MRKENSGKLLERVTKRGIFIVMIFLTVIYFFTKSPVYCIMFILGSGVSFLGYYLMIRVVEKIIKRRKGKGLFLLSGLGKMVLISVVFILVSKYSETAVLFYLLGLSVIVLSIIIEGGSQVFRSFKDGT